MLQLSRSSRLRKRLAHGALGLAVAATVGAFAPGSPATAASDAACDPAAPANARVGFGSQNGQDPNSVSQRKADKLMGRLDAKMEKMRQSGVWGRAAAKGHLPERIVVPTYVHILRNGDGSGGATREMVRDQMKVINDAYAGRSNWTSAATKFHFKVVDVDVTRNTRWYDWHLTPDFSDEDREAKRAKRALHRGGWGALNIYIAGLGDGLLGYATFPKEGPIALDGLVLLDESLPGGSAAPYNLGDTAPHEIGHWLGLFHTFENGCAAPGDYIADTPYQLDDVNIFYCGETEEFGDDTCALPGKDPVHNFMSYGDDECLNRFTPDQAQRQEEVYLYLRKPSLLS